MEICGKIVVCVFRVVEAISVHITKEMDKENEVGP